MNSDFCELLRALCEREVKFLVVGGYAVIHYAQPRFTKDLDIWLEPTAENARRFVRGLADFGVPLLDVDEADFATPGTQYVIGRPPVQLDFLTALPGLEFSECWPAREESLIDDLRIPYIGRADLLRAKRAAGRRQDLADIEEIELGDAASGAD
ncbi:MAG: hypothetical protein O3C21_16320 [Verrucomicrobia bacterium]|nr:hypothetical protein [Verrucomicrobiota bacterium]